VSYFDDLRPSTSSTDHLPERPRRASRRDRWDDDPVPARRGSRRDALARDELEGDARDGVDLVLASDGARDAVDPDLFLDDLGPDRRWSTWHSVEKGARGPEPVPS
jgi:hypothetical protein